MVPDHLLFLGVVFPAAVEQFLVFHGICSFG